MGTAVYQHFDATVFNGFAPGKGMDGNPEPGTCLGPAGLALAAGLLLLVLVGAAFASPGAAVVLFMALPALVAVTVLRKARARMRGRRGAE